MSDFVPLRFEKFSCGGAAQEVAIYRHARTEMEFVLVPGGTFTQGANEIDSAAPAHSVTLTKPFLIARTVCTQSVYERVMGANPSHSKGPSLPAESMPFGDATSFCEKAGLTLPTEAQWEYACRAGTASPWNFGDKESDLTTYAWYSANAEGHTHPVAEKPPNALGLYDMHGNVWQMCADWHRKYGPDPISDPANSSGSGIVRVYRGGAWNSPAENTRAAVRAGGPVKLGRDFTGFRPVRIVEL
ncbi:MAG: formylglycine-generating enzyme family protein [Aromatoleum sp.]|nr:formylglycine-generating enzyme family protein [Aromatoleum sp.]